MSLGKEYILQTQFNKERLGKKRKTQLNNLGGMKKKDLNINKLYPNLKTDKKLMIDEYKVKKENDYFMRIYCDDGKKVKMNNWKEEIKDKIKKNIEDLKRKDYREKIEKDLMSRYYKRNNEDVYRLNGIENGRKVVDDRVSDDELVYFYNKEKKNLYPKLKKMKNVLLSFNEWLKNG